MNFPEALEWIYGTQMHGIKLGLEPVRRLLAGLGVRLSGPGVPRFIHVAGTNGKGSVCAMLDSVCRAAGYKTGLFISPHLVCFRERIRINGEMITEAGMASGIDQIRQLVADWEYPPTFFEIATALALLHFQQHNAEVVVLETGMGGRLDATNAVTPVVSVLTPVDLDHQAWLGDSLGLIAREKAGIIKPGVPVVSAPQAAEVRQVFQQAALENGSPLEFVSAPLEQWTPALSGSHQRWNAALAVLALRHARIEIPENALRQGLETVQWPGRFQLLDGRFILDGAHNPAAAQRLVQTWREVYGTVKATIILGVLRDKDLRGVCLPLGPIAARILTVTVKNDRTASDDELCGEIRELLPETQCTPAGGLAEALAMARSFAEPVLVTGSLYLVGEALTLLAPDTAPLERSSQ